MWPCQANTPIARPPTPSATPAVTPPTENTVFSISLVGC